MSELFFGVKCAKGKFWTHVEKFGFTILYELDEDGNVIVPKVPIGLEGCHLTGPWTLPDKTQTPTPDPETGEDVYPPMGFDFYNIFVTGDQADAFIGGLDQTEDDPYNPGEQRMKLTVERTTIGLPGADKVKLETQDPADPKKPYVRNTIGSGPGLQFEIFEGGNGPRNELVTPANIFWK